MANGIVLKSQEMERNQELYYLIQGLLRVITLDPCLFHLELEYIL